MPRRRRIHEALEARGIDDSGRRFIMSVTANALNCVKQIPLDDITASQALTFSVMFQVIKTKMAEGGINHADAVGFSTGSLYQVMHDRWVNEFTTMAEYGIPVSSCRRAATFWCAVVAYSAVFKNA